ncbi:MAG: fimbria/pilus outer membrane usher protein [Deltaproteobacteria bacterium]|nr:fimbria/pilus outer membrane usher protein [Deltaproteobacteria bacterium]
MARSRDVVAFFFLGGMLLLLSSSARCAETAIVGIVLNEENKGEFFVKITGSGDFLVLRDDLLAIGFRELDGDVTLVDGEPYVSLRSIGGVTFVLDEKTLVLRVTALPALLPRRTIDFTSQRQPKVYYPRDNAGFLNYGIHYAAGPSFELQSFDVTNTAGARAGDFLFLSDSTFRKTPGEGRFTRLLSSLTYDRRQDLQRIVGGDFFASSGDLGNGVNLGGISVSKVFRIDPYFIRNPLADFSGLAAFPSEVEVYLDGNRIRTEKISPGEFQLRNLSSYDGAGVVTVVIKDPFGKEQRIAYPYYFTETLLRKGLHEYSYNAGVLRREFGSRSNEYGGPAFSVFHRYGFDDSLTLGFRGEGDRDGMNAGITTTFRSGMPGVTNASLAGSLAKGARSGAAALVNHAYQDRSFSARVSLRAFSREYATAGSETTERTWYETGAGAGYGNREFGFLSFSADVTKKYVGANRRTASLSYSRNVTPSTSVLLTCRNVRETESANEVFLGLTWYPWPDYSGSASYQRNGGTDTERIQAQKNQPVGEGVGFRGTFERRDAATGSSTLANPFVQYNGKHGIYSAEYLGEYGGAGNDVETLRLSASGGVAYVGGTAGFSRPIQDSFGLVTVGGLEGVRVYRNNQEIGRTDGKGKVFVPNLGSYYENQVSVGDRDIPIDYSIPEVTKYVSPPLRSGSVIPFEVRKFQAVTGTLHVQSGDKVAPAEYYEVKIRVGDREIAFPTGKGGEFYMENVPPGMHVAVVEIPGNPCSFGLTVPETDEMIVDLGKVICENGR